MAENTDSTVNNNACSEHERNLQSICRVCGKHTKLYERTAKAKYSKELETYFEINVNEDDQSVHPPYLCQGCRCFLYRKRQTGKKNSACSSETFKQAKLFRPHSSDCEFCIPSTADLQSSNKEIENIIQSFTKLDGEDKLKCLRSIISSIFQEQSLKKSIDKLKHKYPYNKLETLENLDLEVYLKEFDNHLLASLLAITGQKLESIKVEHLIPILESIYRISDPQFIGAWSFLQNLVVYSSSKNKQACNILGTAIPASKYNNVSAFLSDIESSREATCPEGDVIFMFDNEQVVGKSWNITADNKVKMSIVTNVAVVQVDKEMKNLQKDKNLMPGKWLSAEGKEELVLSLCREDENMLSKDYIDNHYSELYRSLDIAIKQVQDELSHELQSDSYSDLVDQKINDLEEKRKYKKCPRCNFLMDKNKRKCIKCQVLISEYEKRVAKESVIDTKDSCSEQKQKMQQFELEKSFEKNSNMNEERYGHVITAHTQEPTDVILLDPVFVNPNSTDSILLVLRHIGRKAGISKYSQGGAERRQWTCVCCDGLPHGIVRKLIEEYFICSDCGVGCLGVDELQKHEKEFHTGKPVSFYHEFDWVLLVTGDGHFEMNLMKSFVKLNWNVFMKTFVDVMGWRSEKAQQAALNCTDNHKTWQMILTFYLGTLLELVKPYVEKCIKDQTESSAEKFISFVKTQNANANYMYIFEMVCKYVQGIMNFRAAIRRNNFHLLKSAKYMTRQLFHGQNHPKYQDLEMYEQFVQQIMPKDLISFFDFHCSLSKSGNASKGQGYDFVLEEENRTVKSWLKRGVPTEKVWWVTCRNHQFLKDVRKRVLSLTGNANEVTEREPNLNKAIFEWRVKVRQMGYLNKSTHGSVLTSITGDVLDQGISNFTRESNRKRSYRMMDMILHQFPPDDPSLHQPVFVLPSEREKFSGIESLTIADIDNKILAILDSFEENSQEVYLTMFKKIRSSKKSNHIEFFNMITNISTETLEPEIALFEGESELNETQD